MDTAAANGLTGLEREEYCFNETLAKQMVPRQQISEVVERVQNMRHSAEMAALLSAQFEERIAALKAAVEKVIEEISQSRLDLVNRLTAMNAVPTMKPNARKWLHWRPSLANYKPLPRRNALVP